MTPEFVFVLSEHIAYEGQEVLGVFMNQTDAKEAANERAFGHFGQNRRARTPRLMWEVRTDMVEPVISSVLAVNPQCKSLSYSVVEYEVVEGS